ncbi:3-hydroxyacyl-ACP dehydratase FabZ [Actinocorallia lasiicapitis]
MRFHLIDRIDSYEPHTSVRGRKLTSLSEEFWTGTDPVMPPPLVLEALCQAATWLVVASTGRRKRAALLQIGSVSFTGDVRPGDVVVLEGRVSTMTQEMAVVSGTATVDGRPVLEAVDVMCALIDATDLQDADETARLMGQLGLEAAV